MTGRILGDLAMDRDFVEALASGEPVPGGGAACAYVGVLGTCLASMVGNLTLGKEAYAHIEDGTKESLERLKVLRENLIELVNADAKAFLSFSDALKMPRGDENEKAARSAAIQHALLEASEVPLSIMQSAKEVLEELKFFVYNGNKSAVADMGAAVAFSRAAAHGACLMVVSNVRLIKDEHTARVYSNRMRGLLEEIDHQADILERYVYDHAGL